MKSQKILRFIIFALTASLIFSCQYSFNLVKRRSRPGYYFSLGREKNDEIDKLSGNTCLNPSNYLINNAIDSVINPEEMLVGIDKQKRDNKRIENFIFSQSVTHLHPRNFSYGHKRNQTLHLNPLPHLNNGEPEKQKLPLIYKLAIIFLILSVFNLLTVILLSIFQPANPFIGLFYVLSGLSFPITRLTGIIIAAIGLFKNRKNPDPTEPKPSDRFSRTALILQIAELIIVPLVIIATILLVISVFAHFVNTMAWILLVLLILFFIMSLVSFIFSTIGLIRVLKDQEQSRSHRLKGLLISIFNLVVFALMVAWIIAVISAISAVVSAATAVFPFLLIILAAK